MGNTWGGSGQKRDHGTAFRWWKKGDASEPVRDKRNPLYYMNLAGRKVAFCEELSQEQAEALGIYKFELDAARVDYSGIPVLTRGDVFAIKPPKRLKLTEPMRDAIEVAARQLYYNNPPDDATIDKMGPAGRYAMYRMWFTQWRKMQRYCKTTALQKSADSFAEFKAAAIEFNGGNLPDKAFWLAQLQVPRKTWTKYSANGSKRLFFRRLEDATSPARSVPCLWAEKNKKWLTDCGLYEALDAHVESLGGVRRHGGHIGEPKMTDHHHRRLRGTYFVDEFGEEWRVLLVEWDDDYDLNFAYYYDAELGDPPRLGQNIRYPRADGSPWPTIEDCENSTVEQVDAWIEARYKPKKRARTTT